VRPLVRVVVATSALLGALGVATPAAAETTEQCHAALNQYRAKAGLDKASSTSIKALAVAAARHAAYRTNVDPLATRSCSPTSGCRTWACSGPT
jgi:hypothetical protein